MLTRPPGTLAAADTPDEPTDLGKEVGTQCKIHGDWPRSAKHDTKGQAPEGGSFAARMKGNQRFAILKSQTLLNITTTKKAKSEVLKGPRKPL